MDTSHTQSIGLGGATVHGSSQLRSLLLDAYRNVPFYNELFSRHGVTEVSLKGEPRLVDLPIITKRQLAAAPPEQRLNRRFNRRGLSLESTSGSTGMPFGLYVDRVYKFRRNMRFLRGLLSVGYRPWQNMMLLTDRFPDPVHSRRNWTYCSVEQPVSRIVEIYLRAKPQALYGFATPLRLLAERLRDSHSSYPCPTLLISTAEMLDAATESIYEEVFRCPFADFYGMTETGLLAWRQPGRACYTTASQSMVIELIRHKSDPEQYRLVVTNLDLRASPIIRFDSGDLVTVDNTDPIPSLTRVGGRRIDAVRRSDGSTLSPYAITDALRKVPGVRRFRVVQQSIRDFGIELELNDARDAAPIRNEISVIFCDMLGEDLELSFDIRDTLIADGTRKFRPVECRMGAS